MWWWLACVRPIEPAPPLPDPVVEAAPPPPPPAPVDPCTVPEGALECLERRIRAAEAGCGESCIPRCAAHPEDPACPAAVESLRATCDLPKKDPGVDGRACRALAWQVPEPERPELLWRGCDANDGWSCLLLAEVVEAGAPLPAASRGDARWLRDQACDLQVWYACAAHLW